MKGFTENLIQAVLVVAVVALSPYAMMPGGGCRGQGERRGESGGGDPGLGDPALHAPIGTAAAQVSPSADPPEDAAAGKGVGDDPDAGGTTPMPEDQGTQISYECLIPRVEIPRSPGCTTSSAYPACRWQVPPGKATGDLHAIWKHTTPDHRWGRPQLVALVMAAARGMDRAYPGIGLVVGDLDAPCDRHATHRSGVDADLYLPGIMAADNAGAGRWKGNYEDLEQPAVEELRAKVLELAKILASCAGGKIRIYYNDAPLEESFLAWFSASGLVTGFDAPMMPHNDLHRFHFHVTIDPSIPILPMASGQ